MSLPNTRVLPTPVYNPDFMDTAVVASLDQTHARYAARATGARRALWFWA
jgi:hypothetical protein